MAEILVAGLSARALSQSARAGGYAPLAADLFRDLDLRASAEASVRIDGDLESGLARGPLLGALETLAAGRSPIGIVCGTGFEDRPALLDELAGRWPLLGNSAEAVARVKDPQNLAEFCRRLRIPHPKWSDRAQPGWIAKRRGGAGGAHVRRDEAPNVDAPSYPSPQGGGEARSLPPCGGGLGRGDPASAAVEVSEAAGPYWQEQVPGEPMAALVLGCRERALVLGFSAQWADPAPGAPFRYGGAVRPATLSPAAEAALGDAARRVVEAGGLVGLNSVDFLVEGDGWTLIEVNPRPGATLDIFRSGEKSLFALHVEACRGRIPAGKIGFGGAAAACIVYARRAVASAPDFAWPDWTADRQPPRTSIEAGAPVCTVLAQADDPAEARRLAEARASMMRTAIGAG